MKKLAFVLIIFLIIGGAVYTVNNYNKSNINTGTAANNTNSSTKSQSNSAINATGINLGTIKTKAIDFKLKDLSGKYLSLSDLKGKNVLLNFWATWCPPCRGEMPEIEKLYQEIKDSNLVIVAVDIGEPLSAVKTFIEQNKYNFKVLLDSDQSVAGQYGISAIPTSFFIDKEGNIVSKHTGAMNLDQMKGYIKALDK